MTKLKMFFVSAALLFLNAPSVLAAATCTSNGKIIPCDQIPKGFIALFTILPLIFFSVGIFLFVFWVIMLIDAIKYQEENKIMWVLIIILLSVLGAIIYYFAEKKKRNRQVVQ